jgi:6-phosphofructokinase 1
METQINTIGVLTSGGDAPGMNSCIRAVVRGAVGKGIKVIGVESGYEGLIHGDFHPMGTRDVGGILQRGGTILKTARSEDFRTPHGQREAIRHWWSLVGMVLCKAPKN